MDFLTEIEFIATALVVVGVSLLTIPKRWGLVLLFFAQIFWTLFGFFTHRWFFMGQSAFLFFLNIVAIWNWKRKGIG